MNMISLKNANRRMHKQIIAMGVSVIVLLVIMMVTSSFFGNELAKDMRPAEGSSVLKTNDGQTVKTQSEQISLNIYQLPTQSVGTLENMRHVTVPVMFDDAGDFADIHYTLAGWYRTADGLELLTSVGDRIVINAHEARLTMANGTTAVIGGGPGSRRRQLQTEGSAGNIVADTSNAESSQDTNACDGMPCQNDGACWPIDAEQYTCDCAGTGYMGATCQTEVDECASEPCQNSGSCTDGVNSYTCGCVGGFAGAECQTVVDSCESGPCSAAGSTCVTGSNSYSCDCPAGFAGEHCEVDIDECENVTCSNNAVCLDLAGDFLCQCPQGFSGNVCDENINECASEPCGNDGVCTDSDASYSCSCSAGWTGDNCNDDISECASVPCNNDAACSDGIDSWACACIPGFSGDDCDDIVNPCAAGEAPCDPDRAECVHLGPGLFSCDCFAGFGTVNGGQTCAPINECDSFPCANGGLCLDIASDFACACLAGFSGRMCGSDADECASAPCGAHGTCTDFSDSYACDCRDSSWAGENCDLNKDECAQHPCLNDGFCTDTTSGYECECPAGFSGVTCNIDADECASAPCQNGGICFDEVDHFICLCPQGVTGAMCESNPEESPVLTPPYDYTTLPTYAAGSFTVVWAPGSGLFSKCARTTQVFGVTVCATPLAWVNGQAECNHIAHVLAQLLDNDADGIANDVDLVTYMARY